MISVIVPIFNAKNYLGRCISSILAQSFKDFELILVDDGSNDGSGEICDEFAKAQANIKVIHKANSGQGESRNQALSLASGEFVAFVDADDFIAPNYLERLFALLSENEADMSVCGYVVTNDEKVEFQNYNLEFQNGIPKSICFEKPNIFDFYTFANFTLGAYFSAPWGKLIKANIVKANHFSNARIAEDARTFPRWIGECEKIAFSKECLYAYFDAPNSLLKTKNLYAFEIGSLGSRLEILEFFESLGKHEICANESKNLAFILLQNAFLDFKSFSDKDKKPEYEKLLKKALNTAFSSPYLSKARKTELKIAFIHPLLAKLVLKAHNFLGFLSAIKKRK